MGKNHGFVRKTCPSFLILKYHCNYNFYIIVFISRLKTVSDADLLLIRMPCLS